ncbi:MAG TPA: hypothetical protein VGQ03_08545 [Nitrososphaera sp.]|jgi:hypothetical protein|nr:hypothetical protein [Nitrososphaera sp.]
MINARTLGMQDAAFVAGSFIASPELRAYAANTIGSSDIINESILSADLKNGEVKASDIATDAVGAAEIVGVTKLQFAGCVTSTAEAIIIVSPGKEIEIDCTISGVVDADSATATYNNGSPCLAPTSVDTDPGEVTVSLINVCNGNTSAGSGSTFAIIFYHK